MNYVEKAFQKTFDFVQSNKVEQATEIIAFLMETVEEYKTDGYTKSSIVKDVLRKLLDSKMVPTDHLKDEIQFLLDSNMIDSLISLLCTASKGLLKINRSIFNKFSEWCNCKCAGC